MKKKKVTITKHLFWRTLLSPWPTVASVGWWGWVGRLVRCKSCVANYFLRFWNNPHEIWYRCLPWGVDVQDSFFYRGRKVGCHGNGILWQNIGEKSCVANYFLIFKTNPHEIWDSVCVCVCVWNRIKVVRPQFYTQCPTGAGSTTNTHVLV